MAIKTGNRIGYFDLQPGRYRYRAIVLFLIMQVIGCDTTYPPTNPERVTANALKVPVNEFLLIRSNNTFAALKFIKPISDGDGGFEYECYYSEKGNGGFIPDISHKTTGKVFEKYKRLPNQDESDTTDVEDDGGQLLIDCKNITVEWSLSTWVYFSRKNHIFGSTEMAFTGTSNLERINYLSEDIKWHQKK